MKTFLKTLVMVISLTSLFGMAHPHESDNRLTLHYSHMVEFSPELHGTISVKMNGDVFRTDIDGGSFLVTQLSEGEMNRIESLIEKAKKGEIKSPELSCMALPTERREYLSDGNRSLLSVGKFPCGVEYYTDTNETHELIQILDDLKTLSQTRN